MLPAIARRELRFEKRRQAQAGFVEAEANRDGVARRAGDITASLELADQSLVAQTTQSRARGHAARFEGARDIGLAEHQSTRKSPSGDMVAKDRVDHLVKRRRGAVVR